MKKSCVELLYGTAIGRMALKGLIEGRFSDLAGAYLRSPFSRPLAGWYIRKHRISMEDYPDKKYTSFHEFFIRKRERSIPPAPGQLLSPCDGWLTVYPIRPDSRFHVKGSDYPLEELLRDPREAQTLQGGCCLVIRLEAGDYHHYCYPDSGWHGRHHLIPGSLHSVQPAALARYPVFTLNKRVTTLLHTHHFGPVAQVEVGALVVGGIRTHKPYGSFTQGEEMGQFELAGSTILLLVGPGRLAPYFPPEQPEVRVKQGQPLGRMKDSDQ